MTTGDDRILVQNRIDFVTGAVRRYLPEVNALSALATDVQALIARADAAALRHEPAEGEWSALRTLGHMIAYARVLHDQLDRMAHMTDPVLPMADDAAIAEHEGWDARSPAELSALFTEAISESGELLKHVPDSSWGRAGVHPMMGRRSITQQVRGATAHLRSHVEQIEASLADS